MQVSNDALLLGVKRVYTVDILYRLPDYPDILQRYIMQKVDVPPDFPEVKKFLEFWRDNIEGKLYDVSIGHSGKPVASLRAGAEFRLN